ncbi:MAG: AI-2E family transporter [Lachnospiraceae bacterium]
MNKEFVKSVRGLVLFTAIVLLGITYFEQVIWFLQFILQILNPFVIGACIAFVLNIPMSLIEDKLVGRIKGVTAYKRVISFILSLFAIILVGYGVIQIIVPQIATTLVDLGVKIPIFLTETYYLIEDMAVKNPELLAYIESIDIRSLDWNSIITKAADVLKNGLFDILNSTVLVFGSVFGIVFDGVIALVFAIYILMQKETLKRQANQVGTAYLSESLHAKVVKVVCLLEKNFKNFISYQCLEGVILGSIYVVVMVLLGFPYAVMIGVLVAVTSLVPIIGAFVGCSIGAFLILVDDPMKALWFIILFVVIQQVEGNLIYPKVVGTSVGLPPIWVLMAVSLGGSLMGIIGMLLFIPIGSTLYTLLREDVYRRNVGDMPQVRVETKADDESEEIEG